MARKGTWQALTIVGGLSACFGILADFQGVVTAVANVYPVVAAFAPIFALAAASSLTAWVAMTVWWNLPAQRVKELAPEIVLCLRNWKATRLTSNSPIVLYYETRGAAVDIFASLSKFGIETPREECLYRRYLEGILPCVKKGDIEGAKEVLGSLKSEV